MRRAPRPADCPTPVVQTHLILGLLRPSTAGSRRCFFSARTTVPAKLETGAVQCESLLGGRASPVSGPDPQELVGWPISPGRGEHSTRRLPLATEGDDHQSRKQTSKAQGEAALWRPSFGDATFVVVSDRFPNYPYSFAAIQSQPSCLTMCAALARRKTV